MKDEEKKDEEKTDEEKKEGEEEITEAAEADVTTTTAEKKTLMQKLMTIKRDLMANKKEEKGEEETAEKKEGEEEVKAEGEEAAEGEAKDELGEEKPKPTNRIKKFFSMKRPRRTTETEEKVEEEKKEGEEEKKEGEEEKVAEEEVKEEVDAVADVVEDPTLKVQLQGRTPTNPSISAIHLKLESWLKFHGVKYENVVEKGNLPAAALLPMQSSDFLATLAAKYEKEMPMELTDEQRNIQHAMVALAEKNLQFAILSWQCTNLDNTIKGYKMNLQTYLTSKAPLALLRLYFKNNYCKAGLKM